MMIQPRAVVGEDECLGIVQMEVGMDRIPEVQG